MYGRALEVAMPADSFRTGVPRFSDDEAVPRYLLPGEDQVRDVVREILSSNEWSCRNGPACSRRTRLFTWLPRGSPGAGPGRSRRHARLGARQFAGSRVPRIWLRR